MFGQEELFLIETLKRSISTDTGGERLKRKLVLYCFITTDMQPHCPQFYQYLQKEKGVNDGQVRHEKVVIMCLLFRPVIYTRCLLWTRVMLLDCQSASTHNLPIFAHWGAFLPPTCTLGWWRELFWNFGVTCVFHCFFVVFCALKYRGSMGFLGFFPLIKHRWSI